MFCDFISAGGYEYICSKCGLRISSEYDYPPIFPCSYTGFKSSDKDLAKKIKNFSSNTSNNSDLAEDAVVENRFRICETCEFFNSGSCSQCGCPIMRTQTYLNKLSWNSEKCPLNKW